MYFLKQHLLIYEVLPVCGKYPIYKTQILQTDRTPVTTSERWNNMPKVQQPAREGQARP